MNTSLVTQGLTLANQLRSALPSKDKGTKTTVYDELRNSSANISDLRSYLEELDKKDDLLLPQKEAKQRKQARALAGPVTQAAHVRLDNRRARLEQRKAAEDALDFDKLKEAVSSSADQAGKAVRSKLKPWKKKVKKQSKAVEKAATKARQKAEKKVRRGRKNLNGQNKPKKTWRNLGIVAALVALLAALAGAVYYFIFGGHGPSGPAGVADAKKEPAKTPPRVEEHASEKAANLVYSTSTDKPAQSLAGDLAEEPAERDEELLGSIDEQLAAHRRDEEAVAEASTSVDDAAEKLRRQAEEAEAEFEEKFGGNKDSTDNKDDEK